MKQENKEKNTKKKYAYICIAIVFLIGFLFCAAWLIRYFIGNARAEQRFDDLKEQYVTEQSAVTDMQETVPSSTQEAANTETMTTEESRYPGLDGYEVPEKTIDFEALHQENADIYAWITVPGTVIDYPILQHSEQVDYYLDHNIDGSKGYPGCIYTEMYNSTDWEDPNTVIYGHNMKNGTMFANLHYYEDSEFFEQNPYVYIYSEDKTRVYQIFGAYEFSDAHLMLNFDFEDPEVFTQYLGGVFELEGIRNNFNTELEITSDDKIVTLVTCIANKPEKRYLVQAVLVAEGKLG